MRAFPIIAAMLLGAASLPVASTAQEPSSRGTISVEPTDNRVPSSFADAVRRALGDADLLALPGAGHGR